METDKIEKPKLPANMREIKFGKFVKVKGEAVFQETITIKKLNSYTREWETVEEKKINKPVTDLGFVKELSLPIVFRERLPKSDQPLTEGFNYRFFKRDITIKVFEGKGFKNVYLHREGNGMPTIRHFGRFTSECQITNITDPAERSDYVEVTESEWTKITQAKAQKLVDAKALFCTKIGKMPDGSTDYKFHANMKFAM